MRIAVTLLLIAAIALAGGATEMAEKLKQRKIDRFFKTISESDLDAAAKKRVMLLKDGAVLGGEFGCIHQALLALHPEYKRADTLLLDERFIAAADAFTLLKKSKDEYLKAYSTFRCRKTRPSAGSACGSTTS